MNKSRWTWRLGVLVAATLLTGVMAAPPARCGDFLEQSGLGLRLGYFDMTGSSSSYDAVYGSGGPIFGIFWDKQFKEIMTLELEYDYFSKSGERVIQDGAGNWVGNGISEKLKIHSFLATLRYDFMKGSSIRPFAGGGVGMYSIEETSAYGDSATKAGWHVTAGARFLADKKVSFSTELRYSSVPSVWGDNPQSVSYYYGEDDAGGLVFAAGVIYNFGN